MAKRLLWSCATVFFLLGNKLRADQEPGTQEQLRALQEQNQKLQQQLQKQQEMIDARFSQIIAPGGYPIVGDGQMNDYFFSTDFTKEYGRLSLGLGYRFSQRLLVKAEYSLNQGVESDDTSRGHENLFAMEKFAETLT